MAGLIDSLRCCQWLLLEEEEEEDPELDPGTFIVKGHDLVQQPAMATEEKAAAMFDIARCTDGGGWFSEQALATLLRSGQDWTANIHWAEGRMFNNAGHSRSMSV